MSSFVAGQRSRPWVGMAGVGTPSELLRSITDEISGDFERAVILWMLDPAERDVVLANEAARKWQSGNRVLVEIACSHGSAQLFAVRQAYHERFKRSLEEDIAWEQRNRARRVDQVGALVVGRREDRKRR